MTAVLVRPRHLRLVRRRARRRRRRPRRRTRPARRPDRPERRRQDDASSTPSPGSCPIGGTVSIDGRGRHPHRTRTSGRGAVSPGRGRRPSCSTTSRVRENLTVAARHPTALRDDQGASAPDRSATSTRSTKRSSRLSLGELADALADRAHPGPAQDGVRRPSPRRRGRSCCCSTSRPPASTPASRSALGGTSCARSSTTGSPILLVDHDMGLVLGSATSWW